MGILMLLLLLSLLLLLLVVVVVVVVVVVMAAAVVQGCLQLWLLCACIGVLDLLLFNKARSESRSESPSALINFMRACLVKPVLSTLLTHLDGSPLIRLEEAGQVEPTPE